MSKLPTLAILGPGKVGTSIGVLAARAGYPVVAVGGRHQESTIRAARRIGKNVCACSITKAAQSARIVFLCLPDDVVETVCEQLAQKSKFVEGAIIVHCSGSLSSDILSTARDCCKCSVVSFHPLQTFPTLDAALKGMNGIYCFCEGDKCAITVMMQFAKDLGLKPVQIARTSKISYHAAAVMASNYLVVLLDSAFTLMENAGIDRATAWLALEPLVTSTLNNITDLGIDNSLTGPIARGDMKTISRHLQELALTKQNLASVYQAMGLCATKIALRKGSITATEAARAKALFLHSSRSDS